MRWLLKLGLAAVLLAITATPVLGAKPAGTISNTPCWGSYGDSDGYWPSYQLFVSWSGLRVTRVVTTVESDQALPAGVATRDILLARPMKSGETLSVHGPMKYFDAIAGHWSTAVLEGYRVQVFNGSAVIYDFHWSRQVGPVIPGC